MSPIEVLASRAALDRTERPRLTNRAIDTYALARRLARDEVPDLKLGTLAAHLRLISLRPIGMMFYRSISKPHSSFRKRWGA